MSGLRIGLVTDTPTKRHYLGLSAREAGHTLAASLLLAEQPDFAALSGTVDAWVVDVALPSEEEPPEPLRELLENASEPLILSDSSEYRVGSDEHCAWLKRILAKLRQLTGDINLQSVTRAQTLWVLAASTGGPAAVKEFLSRLPPSLEAAFIYVQHIDAGYVGTLVSMMSQGAYPAQLAQSGDVLQANRLMIVSANERVTILENGTLATEAEPWQGPYSPSVDQLVANAARVYGEQLGLIVFTGMGEDGAAASRLVRQRGGQVWVQSPESCTSSSMPDAVLATGAVNGSGTPTELADQLAARYRAATVNPIEEARPYESPTTH